MRNFCQFIGNLAADPEMFEFDNGTKKASFRLGVTTRKKNKEGEYEDNTQWINAIAWGGHANTVEKCLAKGNQVLIRTEFSQRSYKARDSDETKYVVEFIVREIVLLEAKKNQSQFA